MQQIHKSEKSLASQWYCKSSETKQIEFNMNTFTCGQYHIHHGRNLCSWTTIRLGITYDNRKLTVYKKNRRKQKLRDQLKESRQRMAMISYKIPQKKSRKKIVNTELISIRF